MKCPKCGNPMNAAAAVCPHCAFMVHQPVMGTAVAMTNLTQAYAEEKRRHTMIAVMVGVCALVAAVIVGATQGAKALGFGADRQKGTVLAQAGQSPDTGVLLAPGQSSPPVLNQQATAPEKMPQDIYDWLEHLRKCEERREEITKDQLGKAMTEKAKQGVQGGVDAIQALLNGMDDPSSQLKDPTEGLAILFKSMRDENLKLVEQFNSFPPPSECVPIRDAYDRTLRETAAWMGDIGDSLAAKDTGPLLDMAGKSKETIDTFGLKADRLVGEICHKYNTAKWFKIHGDITSGGIFGSMGGL